jgi:serine O-acetyltransferase
LYSIDIDYKANIKGGVTLIHGVGTVIGSEAIIEEGCVIYHGVTLGIKGTNFNDGFPTLNKGVVLGAGCKLLGKIDIGENSIVGANVFLTKDLDSNTIVKISEEGSYLHKKK